MLKKKYKVTNKNGVNARYATALVNICMDYECDINIHNGKKNANFKSIMGVMSLAISSGNVIEIICNGEDEDSAIKAIETKLYELSIGKEI